jgi:hypothetical protein
MDELEEVAVQLRREIEPLMPNIRHSASSGSPCWCRNLSACGASGRCKRGRLKHRIAV